MAALTWIGEEIVKNLASRWSRPIAAGVLFACLAGGLISNSSAQGRGEEKINDLPHFAPGSLFEPQSNYVLMPDFGKRAHSNVRILVPPANPFAKVQSSAGTPPFSGYFYETPASLACVYGLIASTVAGCNPNLAAANVATGSRSIALVDAYDYPGAKSDLTTFSRQFGLPAPSAANFRVVYATGAKPPSGVHSGWDLEAALDLDMAHALAPRAKLYLVEAASSSLPDMFQAVRTAASLVAGDGGGEVSMSWGSGDFATENIYDSAMATTRVVYFAAAGDGPGTLYPCTSPKAVCVGGTANSRNAVTRATSLGKIRAAESAHMKPGQVIKMGSQASSAPGAASPTLPPLRIPGRAYGSTMPPGPDHASGTAGGASSAGQAPLRRSWRRSSIRREDSFHRVPRNSV
jgi:hypothetical protein